jgi:glycosyltransferase EpsF
MALKVLHLITSVTRGGIEKWLLTMAASIPRNEIAMSFSCKGPSVGELAPQAEQLGARVYHTPLRPTMVGYAREVLELLRRERFDLVHNHLEAHSGIGAWIARNARIPVISSYHNTYFPPGTAMTEAPGIRQLREAYSQLSVGYALRHSHRITGCSNGVLESLYGSREQVPEAARTLYYGIDIPTLPRAAERRAFRAEFGWDADTPVLLHVGRFAEQKNHTGLLNIFEKVRREQPGARLLLVGKGPLEQEVARQIRARGLSEHALILGVRDDVPRLMTLCDVFVFPSLHEGFGLVAIEANAARLPVVGSRIAGLCEAVEEGQTALLHEVEDEAGMARSVLELLEDESRRTQLGRAGRERARKQFSHQAGTRRLREVYHESLGIG